MRLQSGLRLDIEALSRFPMSMLPRRHPDVWQSGSYQRLVSGFRIQYDGVFVLLDSVSDCLFYAVSIALFVGQGYASLWIALSCILLNSAELCERPWI